MPKIGTRLLFALGLMLLLAPGAAEGTSYLMMGDEDLHGQAAVIAQVEVLNVSHAPTARTPSTDYIVLVERLLKGDISGTTVVVRVIGGTRPDGMALKVFGAPGFEEGDRAIFFLQPRDDGTYGILHLMLGAFVERERGPERLAMRNLGEALDIGSNGSEKLLARDFDRFADWLADRSAKVLRSADYFRAVERPAVESHSEQILTKIAGVKVRFFEFDNGDSVRWRHRSGLSGAKKSFRNAIKAINQEPTTLIELKHVGKTKAKLGFTRPDNTNSIIFNDPNNEISSRFSCDSGGVIAIGGFWFTSSPFTIQKLPQGIGKGRAHVATEGDIITAKGTKCLFNGDTKAREQVFGHELIHSLGVGHACGDGPSGPCNSARKSEALMRATFHQDGRGADLKSHDVEFLDKLY